MQSTTLRALGSIFVTYPQLMIEERSVKIMDEIFEKDDINDKIQILKVIQKYLIADENKKEKVKKDEKDEKEITTKVTVEELVGENEKDSESNVGPRIIQRYLKPIMKCSLSNNKNLSLPAIDIVEFIVKQGLSHPMESLTTLIALECNPSIKVSNKAKALHKILNQKYQSLLNNQYLNSVIVAVKYQLNLVGDSKGCIKCDDETYESKLSYWFNLNDDKRLIKLDFLIGLLKFFNIDLNKRSISNFNQFNVEVAKFLSDNILNFNYKSNEEVLLIGKLIINYLSNQGEQLRDLINIEKDKYDEYDYNLGLITIVYQILIYLKIKLKSMFGFNEQQFINYKLKKKSTFNEKLIHKINKDENLINYNNIPGSINYLKNDNDVKQQFESYLNLLDDQIPEIDIDDDDIQMDA